MANDKPIEKPKQVAALGSAYLNARTAISEIECAQSIWGRNWLDCVLHIRMAREQLESAEAKIRTNVKGLE